MPDLRQIQEDRALRDAAKGLLTRDIAHLRGDVEEQGVGKRTALRLREGAEGLADDAGTFVRDNPGRVGSAAALGLGLILVYAFRDTIADWLERVWNVAGLEGEANDAEISEQSGDAARIDND